MSNANRLLAPSSFNLLKWIQQILAALGIIWPLPAKNLRFTSYKGVAMAAVTVTVSWTPSTTPGITGQTLTVVVNNSPLTGSPFTLAPGQSSYQFQANELDNIQASLVESIQNVNSPPLSGTFQVPEFTPPAPATNMQFSAVLNPAPTPAPAS